MSSDPHLADERALLAKGEWGEPVSSHSSHAAASTSDARIGGEPASSRGMSSAASAGDADIKRLLFEAQVSAIPDALPSLPWEVGPFKHIFLAFS